MPEGFSTGYENMPLQTDWVWVAEKDGKPEGVLMVAPCHGLIYMMRLCAKEDASPMVAVCLLRACMRESKRRGFRGFFTHIDPTKEMDRRISDLPEVRGHPDAHATGNACGFDRKGREVLICRH